ncbi:MAG: hypothetical protein Q9179_000094 [Wetmoreana sp. 5 TL-2023]
MTAFRLYFLLIGIVTLDRAFVGAHPSLAEYIIWPSKGLDKNQMKTIEQQIAAIVRPSKVWPYETLLDGVIWWLTNCTKSEAGKVRRLPGVELNTITAVLGHIAQTPDLERLEDYVYPFSGGAAVSIYHIEQGINAVHEDFGPDYVTRQNRVRWRFSPVYAALGSSQYRDESEDGHSTYATSKAAGLIYGAAKRAELVAVKMRDLKLAEVSSVLDSVLRDILQRDLQNKSVVSILWTSKVPLNPSNLPRAWQAVQTQLQHLYDKNAVVVVAAGNIGPDAPRSNVDLGLAVLGSPIGPLIVVGNAYNHGRPYEASKSGPLVTVWAPGEAVRCAASSGSPTRSITQTGTSFGIYSSLQPG